MTNYQEKDLTYKLVNHIIERRMDGHQTYSLFCNELSLTIDLKYKNSDLITKELLRNDAWKMINKIPTTKTILEIGDIF